MQISVPSIRITSLYGSQHTSVDFDCKTATFGPELQVSMGPSTHLWILIAKLRLLDPNYKSLWVPDLTCRFVHAKQGDLHQTDKSIWVPASICGFVHAKLQLLD